MNQDYYELKLVKPTIKVLLCFKERRIVVGHVNNCDVILPHEEISPIHAVIEVRGNDLKIYDMNSRGIF